jgi:hypothetical protein
LLGLLVAAAVSTFSWALLEAWFRWFERHRVLYNFRNETLHRLELQLGMYHFLRVVEAEGGENPATMAEQVAPAKLAAYALPDGTAFAPIYSPSLKGTMSGFKIAKWLARGLPVVEFFALVCVVLAERF